MEQYVNIACKICDLLGIEYVTELPSNSILAVDSLDFCSNSLLDLQKTLSSEHLKVLYEKLLLTWFFKSKPLTAFDWGITRDGQFIPFYLVDAFMNDSNAINYTTQYNLPAQPINMCLVAKCENYINLCKELHKKLTENIDKIMLCINNADLDIFVKVNVSTLILDSFHELSSVMSLL